MGAFFTQKRSVRRIHGYTFCYGASKGDRSIEVGKQAAEAALAGLEGATPSLAVVFCSSTYDYKEVLEGIRQVTKETPLVGCSSAGAFTERGVADKSVVVGLISSDIYRVFTGLGKGLRESPAKAVDEALSDIPTKVEDFPHISAIILQDGLAGKGEETALLTAATLGQEAHLFGGAAGDELALRATTVLCDGEFAEDAVSICVIHSKKPLLGGVKHGHVAISEDLKVTKSEGSVLKEVNGKPAWDVWIEATRERAKEVGIDVDSIPDDEVGTFLIRYELGLNVDEGYKVRAPLGKNSDGSLNFVCQIPEGAIFRVLESTKEGQIKAAQQAAQNARLAIGKDTKLAGALVFECVCRGIILGDDFSKGLDAISKELGGVPYMGFETYGEIAMSPKTFSGFHNTTTVVMLLPE